MVTRQHEPTPGRPRRQAEWILGAAAQPGPPRASRRRREAPPAVRRAALVVAVEGAALTAVALVLTYLTLTGAPESVGRAVGSIVYVGLGAALLLGAAVGLLRVTGWSRGPVIVLQLLLAAVGYTMAFPAQLPLLGLPVLVLVATELYLLATPEARLAFHDR